jgi:hypothetical protein
VVDDPTDDPIKIDAEQLDDLWNIRSVSFKDRTHQYDDGTVTATDQGSVKQYGERKGDPTSLPCVKDPNIARLVVQLLVQQSASFARPFVFDLPWWADQLEECDLVTVNSKSMGLVQVLCMITGIDEDADTGKFTIHATEILIGTGTAAAYDVQMALGGGINRDGNGNEGGDKSGVLFNPPTSLTNGELQVWGASYSSDKKYGGVEYWVGFDGTSFDFMGRGDGRATFGEVSSGIPIAADYDETSVLDVDLSASQGTLISATPAALDAAVRLCWVGGEVIAYRDAELIGPYQYRLTGLRRALYDTVAQAHSVNQPFVLLDDQLFKFPYREEQVGKPIFVKTPTFSSVKSSAVEDLADVEPQQLLLMPPWMQREPVLGLTVAPVLRQTLTTGAALPRIVLSISCSEPVKQNRARFEFMGPTATQWQNCSPPQEQYTQEAPILSESGPYSVRARFETLDGKTVGPWASVNTIVPASSDILTLADGTPVTEIDGTIITVS